MPVKTVTKTMFECTCSHPECRYHDKPWYAETIPVRCASCKRRTWNRPRRIRTGTPLSHNGETMSVAAWSRKLGLTKTTIPWRIKEGWPMEQVLSSEDWRKQQVE